MTAPRDYSTEPTDDCNCGGDEPGWDYHHPDGCAATAQAFNMLFSHGGLVDDGSGLSDDCPTCREEDA